MCLAKDKESVVKILLDHKKVDVSARKSQCIFEAVTNGNVELTRLFLSMDKVDPNGRRLLVEAGARCYSEVVSLLLSSPRFVPTEQDLRTCLANATGYYSNSLDVCRVLIRFVCLLRCFCCSSSVNFVHQRQACRPFLA